LNQRNYYENKKAKRTISLLGILLGLSTIIFTQDSTDTTNADECFSKSTVEVKEVAMTNGLISHILKIGVHRKTKSYFPVLVYNQQKVKTWRILC